MSFDLLDLIIVLAAVMAGVGGYRIGFVTRVTSWIGLGLGLAVAARFLPKVVDHFKFSTPTSRLLLAAGVLVIGAFIGQALGLLLGSQIHRVIPMGRARSADRVVGAAVGALGLAVAVWLLLPSIAEVPGTMARQARGSQIARFIDHTFPRPPDTLQALRRLVGKDNFPRVFDALRPTPNTGAPPPDSGLSPTVVSQVSASTVRVEGQACDRIQDGSGFVVAPETVVTNAHVVAGEKSTVVFRPDGFRLPATTVAFDSDRDLAVLNVPGLWLNPLPLGSAKEGDHGAVFGHPNGVPQLTVAPAAIRSQVMARGRDLYDRHSTTRDVFILAADLHPGDSGGPLVNDQGAVVGVAFAISPDRSGTSYALTSSELRAVLSKPATAAVSTGACLANS
jgi:S1-C subfamily serine protease